MTQIHEELLSIVSDLIGLIHPDGRIELSSEVWRGRLCPQAAECQSMKVSDLIHVDDVGEFNRSIQRALAGELVEPFETRIRNREGHSLWICWRIQKSSVHHGAVFSGKDVSAEKTSRTQLQQIGEVSCIGGWEIDLEQMKLHWSPETYAIHEVDPQTFEPKLEEGVSFYIDESKNIISEAVKAMFETGKCFDLQLRFRTAKGSLRWVRSVSRVEFRAGRVVRCYGSIQDITEQVEKDSRTRAMNERFEAIVNNIPLMVSYFNPQGQFEWINPGWTSELGWDLESMKNVDMMEEFYPDPTYRKEVIEFMMSGATDWRDFLTRKRDGSFINTSWANVRLSNGYSIGIGRNIEESKRLNDDLRDAYDRLTLAMSVGGLGTWELYPKTGQVKFSDQWCKMMGLNPKDVVQDASTWKSLAHPVDAEIGYAGTYRCLNGEIPVYQGIQRLRHANGSWVWVQTSGQVVKRDESGAPEKFLAITLDVTHIKDSEEQLVEHNQVLEVMKQRLELAVRAGRFGVWDWNMKSGDLVWDAMMYDLFEIDPLHFSNDFDAFQKCLHPEDTGRVRDQLDFTFRTRASEFRSEFRVITKTGAIKTIAALASCFYDSDGNIDRLVGNNWDVTEQRNAEAALAEARVEAERFFTMSLDLLAVAGIDGYLKRVNPSFTKVLGFTEEELLAKPYAEFVHPDDYAATLLEAERLARGIPTRHFENRYRTKEGKYRTFSWVSTADLETKTIYCAVRDLTDQRESEVRLLQSAKMASLGEMAGGIAHEVNNPLAIIHGRAAQILRALDRGEVDIPKLKTDISRIEATADRIAKIVRGLRTFSRDSSSDPMAITKVNGMIAEVLDLARERFKNHEVNLSVSSDEDLLISCRPQQIGQVLLNLINNAHDAVLPLEERWVRIDVQRKGTVARISVTDSGKGIPAEIASKIMNPFFTTKPVGKGTGLGLSISKSIAEDHGGSLTYDGTSANTCFVFEVPLANAIDVATWRVS